MEREKTFIVGDIHGCLHMLKRLMDKIPWRPGKDTLIFIGDYIDRGSHSKGVVDYILDLIRDYQRVNCLLGNHEAMLLDYLSGKDQDLYLANRGFTTLKNYLTEKPKEGPLVPPDHISFYHSLRPFMELRDYYVVHAGFRPGIEIGHQTQEDMTWIREPFISSAHDFGKMVIFGHTPFREPLVTDNKIGLDTGAVYGNRLTCVELPEERFYSVKA
ncbi:MAG: serine/threonine protein phosphatase [Proteobacteria bacterium]|jgi:serine/threonine protein phosphatase 1|nr:serine/threonine protein phosphatase [Desulfobacterales bacterium]MBL6966959.1 serine/threonine protein phosphatase [Desulfobacteraceae bacterium]MBU0736095.1 serine/threonine protein phosphatase [Pseudomonadota bacterium]MBL7101709.1 serine/threonine protein phosphatase [Desulfobacteraceae bacterium]MBL7172311.1 serine/threonine protein phosphatase [Desulfobacteraceae bacterium]